MHDGSALVARAAGKVTQRANKVGELTGCGALGCHIAHKVCVLLLNLGLDSRLKLLSGERSKIVVRKILKLKLVRCTLETGGTPE